MSLVFEYQLPGFYVRKEPKKWGMKRQIEGELPNNVILVDDIITSGKSILQCIDAIKRSRHETRIIGVFPLIDRTCELENYDLFFQLRSKDIIYQPIFKSLEFINV
jgi:orotate phosphoribosyltransferase